MNFLTNEHFQPSDPGPGTIYCYLVEVDVPCILLLTIVIVRIKNSECTLCKCMQGLAKHAKYSHSIVL